MTFMHDTSRNMWDDKCVVFVYFQCGVPAGQEGEAPVCEGQQQPPGGGGEEYSLRAALPAL